MVTTIKLRKDSNQQPDVSPRVFTNDYAAPLDKLLYGLIEKVVKIHEKMGLLRIRVSRE